MQLDDIIKPLNKMSEEELMKHLREVRHRRDSVRTVAKAKVTKAKGKAASKKLTGLANIMASMTPEERQQLIEQLGETNE